MQGVHTQSDGQVLQFSPQSHEPLPQELLHTLVLVIVHTILVAWEVIEIDGKVVQFVQFPTGVGVRLHVPAP